MHHAIPVSASLICSSQAMQHTPARAVGCFKLPTRHALTLIIRAPGELRLAHGQAWLTFANAAQDATVRAGDHFLQAGEVLHLACGQQVVMESMNAQADSSVYFSWEPDAALSLATSPRHVQHAQVRQPLMDLGAALHQAAWALSRLVHGLGLRLACSLMLRRSTS
ncbi:MAG: DUF2917 domain-containing protein [Polaromonas sp.]